MAEEREVKLANEDTDLEKKLGGRKSSLYRALCRLAAANGLTQNYQNKDQVILALMEYQIQPHDLFTQNDLTRFRRKIQVMAELRTLRPQIVEAKKTRGDVMSLGTIATQVTASH